MVHEKKIIIDDVAVKTPFILPSSRASFTIVSEALSTVWLSQITSTEREVMLGKENISLTPAFTPMNTTTVPVCQEL